MGLLPWGDLFQEIYLDFGIVGSLDNDLCLMLRWYFNFTEVLLSPGECPKPVQALEQYCRRHKELKKFISPAIFLPQLLSQK